MRLPDILISSLISVLLLPAIGCDRRPEGVLPESKMVDIMSDLQIAEAMTTESLSAGSELKMDDVLKSDGATKAELDCTLNWYGHNMDKYLELYLKVDKELQKRKNRIAKNVREKKGTQEEDVDLWGLNEKAVLTKTGLNRVLVLSVKDPILKKGDLIEWKLRINSTSTPTISVLGAEYADGSLNYVIRRNSGVRSIATSLQTDSSKKVVRLFGTFRSINERDLPLWIDSISVLRQPMDSVNYYKFNQQIQYKGPSRRRTATKPDTIQNVKPEASVERNTTQTVRVTRVGGAVDPSKGVTLKKFVPATMRKKQ